MRAVLLSLALVLLAPFPSLACDDNNPSAPDPPPWDLGGDGSWGSNGDGSFTDIGDEGGAPQGYTPPPAPSVQWLSLPPDGWAAGDSAQVDATGTDSAGILSAVLIDQSVDGGATWNPLAYAGASGSSGESDGGVTAQAGTTYQFRAWSSDTSGQVSPTIYSSLYAIPAPPTLFVLSVSAVGPGSVSSPGGTYTAGSPLSLTASPNSNGVFEGWSGDLSGSAPTVSFTLNGSMTVVAQFQVAQASLSVSTIGPGSVSSSGGTYSVGSDLNLTATPDSDSVFVGWSGDLSSGASSVAFTLNQSMSLVATFQTAQAVLAVSVAGPGSVSSPGGTYAVGTNLNVMATPASNGVFEGWSGDFSSPQPSLSFTLNRSMSLVANFQVAEASLEVMTQGSGSATGSGSYPTGSRPTVTASPAAYWVFAGWSPPGSVADSHAPSTTALLDSDLTLTATFTPATVTLSTSVSGTGLVSGGGTYPQGGTASVSASPGAGYRWIGWSGDLSGTATPATVLMDTNKQLTANFAMLLAQVISFSAPPTQLTTAPPLTLSASASSGLPVALTLLSGPASLLGNVITLSGQPGTVSVSASQAGNAQYAAAAPVVVAFSVTTPPRGVSLTSGSAASKKNDPKTPVTDYQPSHP